MAGQRMLQDAMPYGLRTTDSRCLIGQSSWRMNRCIHRSSLLQYSRTFLSDIQPRMCHHFCDPPCQRSLPIPEQQEGTGHLDMLCTPTVLFLRTVCMTTSTAHTFPSLGSPPSPMGSSKGICHRKRRRRHGKSCIGQFQRRCTFRNLNRKIFFAHPAVAKYTRR